MSFLPEGRARAAAEGDGEVAGMKQQLLASHSSRSNRHASGIRAQAARRDAAAVSLAPGPSAGAGGGGRCGRWPAGRCSQNMVPRSQPPQSSSSRAPTTRRHVVMEHGGRRGIRAPSSASGTLKHQRGGRRCEGRNHGDQRSQIRGREESRRFKSRTRELTSSCAWRGSADNAAWENWTSSGFSRLYDTILTERGGFTHTSVWELLSLVDDSSPPPPNSISCSRMWRRRSCERMNAFPQTSQLHAVLSVWNIRKWVVRLDFCAKLFLHLGQSNPPGEWIFSCSRRRRGNKKLSSHTEQRFPGWTKRFPQSGQGSGFSPPWIRTWSARLDFSGKLLSHCGQGNSSSAACALTWSRRLHFCAKLFPQRGQRSGVSWSLAWSARRDFHRKLFPQRGQGKGRSPVWLRMWFPRCDRSMKLRLHRGQQNSRRSVCSEPKCSWRLCFCAKTLWHRGHSQRWALLSCSCRRRGWLKLSSHAAQRCGPACVSWWRFIAPHWEKLLPQSGQEKGLLSPACASWWTRSIRWYLNCWPHTEQRYGFSPERTRMWTCRAQFLPQFLPQKPQRYGPAVGAAAPRSGSSPSSSPGSSPGGSSPDPEGTRTTG
ncbi:hypothetical protein EYF80_038957 [Liparis tanakae]|uniref:Uncharacterized protein n=1 Tax=Liparis tanakae TaxID=230148 RepID=A0A4Z2GDS4_9TELE|nr:hypothetical protein EYF80_038957 [Liparis tanakae]